MPAFLKLGDIKGEATDADHKEWIFVELMTGSIFRSIPEGARDQQRTKGETTLQDIVFVRQMDKSSTKLQEACANGTFFKDVEIHFCSTVQNKQAPYLSYKLKNAIVSSYSMHAVASGAPLPSEEVTLSYTEAEWIYFVLDPKTGNMTGQVPAKYSPGKGHS